MLHHSPRKKQQLHISIPFVSKSSKWVNLSETIIGYPLPIWVSFCRPGKRCKLCLKNYFETKLWPNGMIFQDFSTVLKSFCPVESKNSFILVQANFHCFYPQSAIFSNFWGRYIAFQELNVHCWAWTMVRCPSYWKVYFYDFRFLGSSLAHREPKL